MPEQNTPIGGNMNMQTNTDINALVANIMALTQNTKELGEVIKTLQNNNLIVHKNLIKALKDVQASVSSTSNKRTESITSKRNADDEYKKRKAQIEQEIKGREDLIKDVQKSSNFYDKLNKELQTLNKSISLDGKYLGNNFKSVSSFITDFGNAIKANTKQELDIKQKYAADLLTNSIELNNNQKRLLEIQNLYSNSLSAVEFEKLVIEEDALKKDIEQQEKKQRFIEDSYNDEMRAVQRQQKLHEDEFSAISDSIAQRKELESRNEALLSEGNKRYKDRINKINDFFNPKSSKEYQEKYLQYAETEQDIQQRMEAIEKEDELNNKYLEACDSLFNKYTNNLKEIEEKLNNKKLSNEDKKSLQKEKQETQNKLKEAADRRAEYKTVQDINKKRKALCEEDKKINADFKKSIDKSFSLGKSIVDVVGKGIEALANREIELYKQAADTVFDSLEKTQQELGKTLKMSSGQYDEFVDTLQAAAKEEGYAIDSTQLLDLASNLADMGIRDENLLKSFAVSQAKASEAGVGSIFQMNEEFIKQYQRFYKETAATEGEDVAQQKLEKALGEWVAIEKAISDEYGSATALAQGGMTEIANYANELQKSNFLNQENSGMFMYGLSSVAQAVEDSGGDFSLILSDLKTILENPESDLSASLLSYIGTDRETFMQKLSSDATGTLEEYITKMSDRYAGLNLTDLTYKMQAYGESMTPSQMKGILNTSTSSIAKVTQEGLDKTYKEVSEGLSEGTYLTATEKLEKRNIQMAEDVAQIAQKVADGKYWMDNTLNAGQSLLSDFISGITSALGNIITRNLPSRTGSGTGTTTKGGAGDFLTGNKATQAGKLGAELSGAAGILYGEYTLLSDTITNIKEGDNLNTAIGEAFADPKFSSGMGMALGGAIGGPVGAAVGGYLGEKVVPKAQEAFEDLITKGIGLSEAEAAYKQQQEAANELKSSAGKLTESANAQMEAVNKARQEAESYSTTQKKQWLEEHQEELKSSGILTEDMDLSSVDTISDNFAKYFDAYQDKVEQGINMQLSRGDLGTALADNISKYVSDIGVNVGDKIFTSTNELRKAIEAGEVDSTEGKHALKTLESESKQTDIRVATNKAIATMRDTGETTALLNQMEEEINKAMAEDGNLSREQAIEVAKKNLAKSLGYSEEQTAGLSSIYDTLDERRKRWEEDNAEFQKKFEEAQKQANSHNVFEIAQKYEELYGEKTKNLFDYVVLDPNALWEGKNVLSENETIDTVPFLTTKGNTFGFEEKGSWKDFPDIPQFKTGLDYVPYDNYLALLHQGETVLNSSEAQDYRDNTSINFDTITNTLVSQTDRIENILNKILTAITYMGKGGNSSSLNPNIVNMVSGIATL